MAVEVMEFEGILPAVYLRTGENRPSGFINMDPQEPGTLLDLAMQTVVKNESIALCAVEELPRELLIPLFNAAFTGGHKNIVKALVRMWPFSCLHVGALDNAESFCEILEAMLDGLQFFPVHNSSSWVPKLRILDLRQNADCKTTCFSFMNKFPFCNHACTYSQNSILKLQGANNDHSTSESQLSRPPMELLVDIYFDGSRGARRFLSYLRYKVDQSLGSLHLCCRDLQIEKSHDYRNIQKLLDMVCIDHLGMDQAYLSEVCIIFPHMANLSSINLSKIIFRSYKRKNFKMFLSHLSQLTDLQELSLSWFPLKNQLHKLLRVLSPNLAYLHLNFCDLTNKDFIYLSESLQAKNLKLLNLSKNQISWEDSLPLRILLDNLSGTLQQLEMNSCLITDLILSDFIPSLRHCSHLRVLSLACNPITMPVLRSLLQNLTHLTELKHVTYPIPVHCYEQWHFRDSLDEERLAEVKLEIRSMLWAAQRTDMKWSTSYE
ncbi:melanoma antigen preferentially expressed in tumors-like [Perognathus longimembris pacificus]|uniref:melanoma antigen preferentially expressed in tumors-like n=1 Tax=Perognathus longimembris pacificus TaxID=214514 RepID=UPI00201A16AF|nr:melanoma antigen preferentially expressed in tumors-like [Perognathus longimembris pacificus]